MNNENTNDGTLNLNIVILTILMVSESQPRLIFGGGLAVCCLLCQRLAS